MRIIRACFVFCAAVLALASSAEAQGNYLIRPGDVLRVEVIEDESLNRNLLVLPDGRVSMPLAGTVIAAGRTVSQVQRAITSGLAASFAVQPSVYVGISSLAERIERPAPPEPEPVRHAIFILGEARNPGRVEVEPGTTVLQLFAQIGGFTNFAATKRIQLRRTDPRTRAETIHRLNYDAIEAGLSRNGLTTVMDGDVFVVPQRRLFE